MSKTFITTRAGVTTLSYRDADDTCRIKRSFDEKGNPFKNFADARRWYTRFLEKNTTDEFLHDLLREQKEQM